MIFSSLLTLLLFIFTLGLSFFATAAIVWAICYCFGVAFTWGIATGVWLILLLLK